MDQPLKYSIVHQPKSKHRKVKVQEHLRPRASKPRSRIRDGRIQDQGLEFETYRIETLKSETFEFEAVISETLEFRDQGFKFKYHLKGTSI